MVNERTPPHSFTLEDLELVDAPPEHSFDNLTKLASMMLGAPVALVSIVEFSKDRQYFKSQVGLPEPWATKSQTPLSHSFCQHVVRGDHAFVVENAPEHPLVRDNLAIPDLGVIAYLGVPIYAADHRAIGALCTIEGAPRRWSDEDVANLKQLASCVSDAVLLKATVKSNEILLRERQQMNRELERKVDERTQQLNDQKERLAVALEKEHELNRLQRQFVSMVCHEFRTPLAIIDGNAHRIIRRHEKIPPDQLVGGLGKVRNSVARLTELMESVLSVSKLEAGTIELKPTPCNFKDLILEVANTYLEVNPTYEISADVKGLPEHFIADPKLMRQVLSNLISNAVKYSPDGAQIDIEATSCHDGGIKIDVHDRGVGIPADELDKLFKRFFRASTSAGIAGTGIGLHMTQAFVEMHGGRVDIVSEVGVGSTFTVSLPRRDDAAKAA